MERRAKGTEFTSCDACESNCVRPHHGTTLLIQREDPSQADRQISLCCECLATMAQSSITGEEAVHADLAT